MEENFRKILVDIIINSNTAALGTLNDDQPFVSLVAYSINTTLCEFYILISDLAAHTKNLSSFNNVSLMVNQIDHSTNNPLNLARVTITGKATKIGRQNEKFAEIKRNYMAKNKFADMYLNLGDFNFFSISVDKARFVAGFAKTFNLTKASLINLLNN